MWGLWVGCLGEFTAMSPDLPKLLAYHYCPGTCSQGLRCEARSQVCLSEEVEITSSWKKNRNDAKKAMELVLKGGWDLKL